MTIIEGLLYMYGVFALVFVITVINNMDGPA